MDIRKVIKTKTGSVTFKGELSEEEHEFVLAVGLNTLMEAGALPMQVAEDEGDLASFIPGSESIN